MTKILPDLKYSKEDEWVKVEDGVATVGITDYAQDSLSDIVYLELPDVGEVLAAEETFGVVESVKAAADLYSPISGTVAEVNEDLVDAPETLNSDPYGEGWLIKISISDPAEIDQLMDADAYQAYCDERA